MVLPLTAAKKATKRFDSEFYVEGYATTFNKPYLLYEFDGVQYFEVIDRNALVGADCPMLSCNTTTKARCLPDNRIKRLE